MQPYLFSRIKNWIISANNIEQCKQLNTLRKQNGQHFTDDIFKLIFINENFSILITISLQFVPKGPINNIRALVQTMAWRHPGDKPLSKLIVVSLPTYICITKIYTVMHDTVYSKVMADHTDGWIQKRRLVQNTVVSPLLMHWRHQSWANPLINGWFQLYNETEILFT